VAKATRISGTGIETKDKGELKAAEYVFVAIPRTQCKLQGWFMGFQRAFLELAKDKEITGETRRVLDWMFGSLDFENFIVVDQGVVAKELDLKQPNVSRSIKKLLEKGIIEKGPKMGNYASYRVNLNYVWKGKAKNREAARKELYKQEKLKVVK
jgi:DNA-binding MarR family transcriptional regulator